MFKLVVIFSNLGPYHRDRLMSLHQHCSQIGWELVAIELARTETDYAWEISLDNFPFKVISLISDQVLDTARFDRLLSRLYSSLSHIKPDSIAIAGYARPAILAALLWSILHRKPAILLSATHEQDTQRVMWRETIKRGILKGYRAALVGGTPQKQYLVQLGMAADAIFIGYNTIRNETFSPEKIKILSKPHNRPYFLAIARFIPKKNIQFLISCYARYFQALKDDAWDLVICGDGELYQKIEHQIRDLGLEHCIYLPGFLQQEELLPYFAHAKCFIHASIQEQWGLVVNEAMAAGLPVIVSNRCGCFEDLILDGINGFSFDPENSQQLTELMIKMSLNDVNLSQMGDAALEHIQHFSTERFAQGLMQALEYAQSKF
jgi:1,2-diacylglycerol 3-alpha-glucosyltransferase